MASKPLVNVQGRIICERDEPGWLIMFADGQIRHALNKPAAERIIRKVLRDTMQADAINVAQIEWRG